jgi:hypothetical protein
MKEVRILTLIRRAGLEAADVGLVFGLQRVVFILLEYSRRRVMK